MIDIIVLGASIILQFVAAFLALRLIFVTGYRTAWILIAIAIILMGVRRSITFVRMLTSEGPYTADLTAELVALTISALMVTGIYLIRPVFMSHRSAEKALRQGSQYYQALFKQKAVGVARIDSFNGRFIQINQKYCDLLGYTEREMLELNFQAITHPEDLSKDEEKMDRLRRGELETFQMEKRYFRKDRSLVWVSLTVLPLWAEDSPPDFHLALVEDITARKKVEETLSLMVERLNLATRSANIGIWDWDIKKDILVWDDRMFELYGVKKEDFSGAYEAWTAGLHPDDRARAENAIRKAMNNEAPYDIEFRVRWPDGTIRFIKADGQIIRDAEGKPSRMIGTNYDITQRKSGEKLLRDSEAKFRNIFDNSPVPYALNDEKQNITFLNEAFTQTFGYDLSDIRTLSDWWPKAYPDREYRAWVESEWRVRLEEAKRRKAPFEPMELKIRCKDGSVRAVLGSAVTLGTDFKGLHLVILYDITDRKKAEEALRESEANYRTVVENQTEFIVRWLPDGTRTFVNDSYCRYFGQKRGEMVGTSFFPLISREDREKVRERIRSVTPENPISTGEHRVIDAEGRVRWQQWTDRGFFDKNGRLKELQSVGRDITERKMVEEALRDSEDSLARAQKIARMGNWDWDLKTSKLRWSEEVYRIFGLEPRKYWDSYSAILKSVHPEDRAMVKKANSEALSGRQGYKIKYRILLPDRSEKVIFEQGEVMKNARGLPYRMIGTVQDVTESHRQAAQIEASLREKDVLLKEIHHRSKNNLQIISSLLNLQGVKVGDARTQKAFEEGRSRIQAIALVHEKLYQAEDLAEINFSSYIEELAESVYRSYDQDGKRIRLMTETDREISLGIDSAVPCGLIINELLSNAFKYAFVKKKKGEVGIRLTRNNGNLECTVWDDGIGLPSHIRIGEAETLGLSLVDTLVRQIGGKLSIDQSRGTAFKFRFSPLRRTPGAGSKEHGKY